MPNIARKGRRWKEKNSWETAREPGKQLWGQCSMVTQGKKRKPEVIKGSPACLPASTTRNTSSGQITTKVENARIPCFFFSFNKFCRSRSVPYQPISSSQLPTVVWERWQGWSETCATSETSRARWRRHQRRHQQQDRQHSFTMELSQPARLTWDIEHKLLMVGSKHSSDDGKLLIAIMGNVMLSLKIFSWI